MQHRNDKTLHRHVENGLGMIEVADAVKARSRNRTWRAPEDLWKGEGDGWNKDNLKSLSCNDQ